MPVITLIVPYMTVRQQETLAQEVPVAVVVGSEQLPQLVGWIEATGALAIEALPAGADLGALEERLREGDVHLIVELPEGAAERLLAEQPVEVRVVRSEEHTSELQSRENLVCRLLLEKKKKKKRYKPRSAIIQPRQPRGAIR